MKWTQRLEIKVKMQEEVYNDTLTDLVWHRDYHDKKMLEYTTSDDVLFAYHYEKYQAYKTLVEHFKHFKF